MRALRRLANTLRRPTCVAFYALCVLLIACDHHTSSKVIVDASTDASSLAKGATCDDYVLNNAETEVDCGGPNCLPCTMYSKSCKALLAKNPDTPSGPYDIDPDGSGPQGTYKTYCDMQAEGGGWTLMMKIDGTLSTFDYSSDYWRDKNLLNEASADLEQVEAKFVSFYTIPVQSLRIGMFRGGDLRWLTIDINEKPKITAYDIFSHQYRIVTNIGRDAWLLLINNATVQTPTFVEGLNIRPLLKDFGSVRIGALANEQTDLTSPDSAIGIGLNANQACVTISAGNYPNCQASGSELPVFAFVLVRE